jgi:hypothetical protein
MHEELVSRSVYQQTAHPMVPAETKSVSLERAHPIGGRPADSERVRGFACIHCSPFDECVVRPNDRRRGVALERFEAGIHLRRLKAHPDIAARINAENATPATDKSQIGDSGRRRNIENLPEYLLRRAILEFKGARQGPEAPDSNANTSEDAEDSDGLRNSRRRSLHFCVKPARLSPRTACGSRGRPLPSLRRARRLRWA